MLSLIVAALIGTAMMATLFGIYSSSAILYGQEAFTDNVSVFTNTESYTTVSQELRDSVVEQPEVTTEQSEVNFINAGFTAILSTGTAVTGMIGMIQEAGALIGLPGYVIIAFTGILFSIFAFAVMKILTGRD